MENYFIALGIYTVLSVGVTKLIREDEAGEMLGRYGIKTKYQRVKEFLCRMF